MSPHEQNFAVEGRKKEGDGVGGTRSSERCQLLSLLLGERRNERKRERKG